MVLNPMFKGKNNSPKAKITSQIDTTSTTIPVSQIDFFPEGPNLATIGTDEDAEVIKYNGKSGNSLTGCERGFGGTIPNTWPIDSYIYRAFTTYDHDTFIDNFELMRDAKHAAKHAFGGYDPITITKNQISDFPTEMAPSAHTHDIKLLTNYQEGSFTPTLVFVRKNAGTPTTYTTITPTPAPTYLTRTAAYVKIGTLTTCMIYLYIQQIPAGDPNYMIRIDGLPFNARYMTTIPITRTLPSNTFALVGVGFGGGSNNGLLIANVNTNLAIKRSDLPGNTFSLITTFSYMS